MWQWLQSWLTTEDSTLRRLARRVDKLHDRVDYLETAIQVLASQIDLTADQRTALRDLKTKADAVQAALDRERPHS
jgi:prefoldin subunit 5